MIANQQEGNGQQPSKKIHPVENQAGTEQENNNDLKLTNKEQNQAINQRANELMEAKSKKFAEQLKLNGTHKTIPAIHHCFLVININNSFQLTAPLHCTAILL